MSPHSATFQDALNALLAMTTWADGCGWIDIERTNLPSISTRISHSWSPVRGPRDRARIVRHVTALDERWSPEMTMCLPRKKSGWGTVSQSTVCWARVEGADQVERARRFKSAPTLVLQEGTSSRRLLIWALDTPLGWSHVVQANKRLAYALRATQKWSDPELLRIPIPGSCIRSKKKPIPVVVGRLDLDAMYAPRDLVGRLKDPPAANWWEKADGVPVPRHRNVVARIQREDEEARTNG